MPFHFFSEEHKPKLKLEQIVVYDDESSNPAFKNILDQLKSLMRIMLELEEKAENKKYTKQDYSNLTKEIMDTIYLAENAGITKDTIRNNIIEHTWFVRDEWKNLTSIVNCIESYMSIYEIYYDREKLTDDALNIYIRYGIGKHFPFEEANVKLRNLVDALCCNLTDAGSTLKIDEITKLRDFFFDCSESNVNEAEEVKGIMQTVYAGFNDVFTAVLNSAQHAQQDGRPFKPT